MAYAKRFPPLNVTAGEAQAALLASYSHRPLHLEGDIHLSIAPILADIHLKLPLFSSGSAYKVSRCANFRAHLVASHKVFGSIPTSLPLFH